MAEFLSIISGFPTVIYTVLLGIILVYWLLAILGAIDIDVLDVDVDMDIDIDVDLEADASSVSGLTGLLSTLGLTGPPVTVILSLLIVLSWLFSYFSSAYLLVLFPGEILKYLAGTVLLVVSFALAIPVTAQVIKPLRGLFVVHSAKSKSHFVGSTCKVSSLEVTDKFGQAQIDDGEAGIIISVRAKMPNTIKKGDKTVVISYDEGKGTYEVVPEEEFFT